MADKPGDGLSRRERQIMDVIFASGEATAVEVADRLPDPPTKTAVRTLLRILEEKGHLKHVQRGREFLYQPTQSRLRASRSAFQRVLKTFFDGSLEKAVAAHLAGSASNLSADELERLANLIHQARNKGK
ncbi:MAG TPA: BlaI/MecI/CopY family transcriptional regulator [Pirellulaceae bacterium]|nr:BlaI/MecI/CopY family transcriptional regulator [Pirellulaceae bacterium]